MIVQVLTTPGCSNCIVLEKMLDQMGIKFDLIDVTEKPEFLEKYPIFMAPGLVINGKLEFTGIPKKADLEKKFSQFQ
ncbi:MAG TPA: thioredoxin family protein [Nitrosarchaeum sp.]|nr:thioredoxin family protein [Nitrosarchaeum sp.]